MAARRDSPPIPSSFLADRGRGSAPFPYAHQRRLDSADHSPRAVDRSGGVLAVIEKRGRSSTAHRTGVAAALRSLLCLRDAQGGRLPASDAFPRLLRRLTLEIAETGEAVSFKLGGRLVLGGEDG